MFGSKKETSHRYDGRLLTVDSIDVPDGKHIRYGDAVIIRVETSKPIYRTTAVEDAMEKFRFAIGELERQPDAVIGLRVNGFAIVPAEMTIVTGTPVYFD